MLTNQSVNVQTTCDHNEQQESEEQLVTTCPDIPSEIKSHIPRPLLLCHHFGRATDLCLQPSKFLSELLVAMPCPSGLPNPLVSLPTLPTLNWDFWGPLRTFPWRTTLEGCPSVLFPSPRLQSPHAWAGVM